MKARVVSCLFIHVEGMCACSHGASGPGQAWGSPWPSGQWLSNDCGLGLSPQLAPAILLAWPQLTVSLPR